VVIDIDGILPAPQKQQASESLDRKRSHQAGSPLACGRPGQSLLDRIPARHLRLQAASSRAAGGEAVHPGIFRLD